MKLSPKVKKILSILLPVLCILLLAAKASYYYGINDLLVYEDDFLTADQTDIEKTTALVFANLNGFVTIHYDARKRIAPHPEKQELYLATRGKIACFMTNGSELIEVPAKEISLQNAASIAYNESGNLFFAAKSNKVYVYGFTSQGSPAEICSVDTGFEIESITKGEGNDFWAASTKGLANFKWNGSTYVKTFQLEQFNKVRAFDYNPEKKELAVIDSGIVRFFMYNGFNYIEISDLQISNPDAYGIFLKKNGDLMITSLNMQNICNDIIYYGMSDGRYIPVAGLSRQEIMGIIDAVDLPWFPYGYIYTNGRDLECMARTSNGHYEAIPSLSCDISSKSMEVSGKEREEIYYSKPVAVKKPFEEAIVRVRQYTDYYSEVKYQMSTDSGATWQDVVPTDITQGNTDYTINELNSGADTDVIFRMILRSDGYYSPVVDYIKILQIGKKETSINSLGSDLVKVKLVK